MIHSLSTDTQAATAGGTRPGGGLTMGQFQLWLQEIQNQPAWRAKADKEADYADGNQLDSDILAHQKQLGIPPAVENLVGPAIDAVVGFEKKSRTDWRLSPENDLSAEPVSKALNWKLNQAERKSGADRALSDAFRPASGVGLGWVEVSRERNPFRYPYRCRYVHRNEIFWDWLSKEPDLSDARYLIRRRWSDAEQAALLFKKHADLIKRTGKVGSWTELWQLAVDGGGETGLVNHADDMRGWTIEEQEWRDPENGRVCLFEVWYRRWVEAVIIRTPDGRVVEYDARNPMHVAMVAAGAIRPERHVISRMYRAYYLGPFLLADEASPYRHNDFPYVPVWGKREDRTLVPFGLIRSMIFLQDNVNASISKIRWGLSATRVERTEGAVMMRDDEFRRQVARPDADIKLNASEMAKAGARFEVKRDFQLSEQQYKMLNDSRAGIVRTSGITPGFQGQPGTARSGVQESTQVEQTTQQIADLMDNFKFARTKVGELLLSMIIEDSIGKPETVSIPGNGIRDDQEIALNVPTTDPDGIKYLTNDVERVRLKVALDDVPSTPSFRAQQLQAMSEAFKAMPPEFQAIALPHLLNLMDVPDREDIVRAVREAQGQESPQQIQDRIDKAVEDALAKAQFDLKNRELDLKYSPERMRAELGKLVSEQVLNGIQAAFAAMQAGQVVASMPTVAPVADVIMKNAGWQQPNPAGADPGYDQIPIAAAAPPAQIQQNTSPTFPARAGTGMEGIETARASDNLTTT